jgi:hypothetical protein
MRRALALCAVVLALAPFRMGVAAEADASDIVILSVKPRGADVKPIAASISASGHDTAAPQHLGDKPQNIASINDATARR